MPARLMPQGPRSCLLPATKLLRRSHLGRALPSCSARSITIPTNFVRITDEVSHAIKHNKPVVALESTIYTHGALGKQLSQEHDDLVRSRGGVPAIIGIVHGVPTVGVSLHQLRAMIEDESTVKVSRRDIAYLAGMGLTGRKMHGGTTIAATMLLAKLAGIRVFGTGGLGGVHRDGQNSMDISADLTELGRTRVAVVCSGCKGFLDIERTLEYLETQGCLVATFADGRTGAVNFPAFWARDSGTASPCVVESTQEAAAMILAQERLGIESGMLFANPVPSQHAVPSNDMASAIDQAVQEAAMQGFSGNRNTPFVLSRLRQLLGDKVVNANKALAAANIVRATDIAIDLSRLLSQSSVTLPNSSSARVSEQAATTCDESKVHGSSNVHVLVAGAVALDLSCDYASTGPDAIQPQPHTSNPAHISQSVGGVGHNVALAAHLSSSQVRVELCSLVGNDVAATTVLSSMQAAGLSTRNVHRLDQASNPGSRTAQYVSVNDGAKNMVLAMADMDIFTKHSSSMDCDSVMAATRPKWLVVDANWSATHIRSWVRAAKAHNVKVAFEPVSVEKSKRLFCPLPNDMSPLSLFPQPSVHLASPNTYELAAMNGAARENDYLESDAWFGIIDSLGIRGARDKFVRLTSADITDAGIPVQSVQLLPYIPTLVTKLGAKGVLVTALLEPGHALLRDSDAKRFILARARNGAVGGVYMRLFPALELKGEAVSVNGAGDSLLGVLISGLAQGHSVERMIDIAQKGAVLSLMCREPVSPRMVELDEEISRLRSRVMM
ncbi:hypothetical protein CDD81_2124 [Ophiocordyceps australis]|uniref:Carbohydrate kinase PfkB domain-containing protein n=1 Tax=Ophiocordyceps australis TaxID=1399860 RepID=A0A2C5XY85_9HYPO|nr:hypothetical protein CDD81_2124 [Ophiocordyceps australis]